MPKRNCPFGTNSPLQLKTHINAFHIEKANDMERIYGKSVQSHLIVRTKIFTTRIKPEDEALKILIHVKYFTLVQFLFRPFMNVILDIWRMATAIVRSERPLLSAKTFLLDNFIISSPQHELENWCTKDRFASRKPRWITMATCKRNKLSNAKAVFSPSLACWWFVSSVKDTHVLIVAGSVRFVQEFFAVYARLPSKRTVKKCPTCIFGGNFSILNWA